MAGRVKHKQRSHKTLGKNYSEFRRFTVRANTANSQKQRKKTIREKLKSLFKRHQDR